ncbi:MAG: enediyne biosynthesis protein E5 [Methyloprofundus sp.]|nr:MAG: enediyne biosynthesis protein E5 [Methyloprofundus sp.]
MKTPDLRLAALRRFALAISALTIIGHGFLGFEQSYAYVLVALITSYSMDLLLETTSAWSEKRTARYRGGPLALVNFLLSAHITALAVAMLLYSNEQLLPIAFATAVAAGSKHIFTVTTERGKRHFLNPSNTGISATLILFPWVGIAPPYQFTENISGSADWIFALFICILGTFLNARFTKKIPLILAWFAGFALQAIIRSWYFDLSVLAALNPMTGLAFLLYTFYMISDPGTSPYKPLHQVVFGFSIALVYSFLMMFHIVFGWFFALLIVCCIRGAYLHYRARKNQYTLKPLPVAGSLL